MVGTVQTGSVTELWQAAIDQAQTQAQRRLPEAQESYLVFTLVRHSRDHLLTGRTLALEFLDGLAVERALREDRLRDVGDRCLLIAGLFPGQDRRRSVGPDYYQDLGVAAYRELGGQSRSVLAGLYAELAQAFDGLVRVLTWVRRDSAGPPVPALAREQTRAARCPSSALPAPVAARGGRWH